jgi:hypothetical protein
MKNKSIISLISFLLVSIFYVASASAANTYVNIKVPTECGTWKHIAHNHCPFYNGGGVGGKTAAFRCVGGGNGKSTTTIKTQHCGQVTVLTKSYSYINKTVHEARVVGTGNARKTRGHTGGMGSDNTHGFKVMLCNKSKRAFHQTGPHTIWIKMCPDGTQKDSRKY